MQKTYTLVVLSNDRAKTKKIVISKARIIAIGASLAVAGVILSSILFDYIYLLYKDHSAKWYRQENQQLKLQLTELDFKLGHLEKSFERMDLFAKKLKAMTQVDDPERELKLAVGQVDSMPVFENRDRELASIEQMGEYSPVQVEIEDGEISVKGVKDAVAFAVRMEQNLKTVELQEQNLLELWQKLSDRIGLLAATPSLLPTKGWITSNFGYRRSPFGNNHSTMHHGVDVAAHFGADVVAPAEGIISFVGYDGSYGNLVSIDHGYGVVTRFGHNAKIHVKVGQRVSRGEKIASVGNTGRSTGTHLHYEVRVNGIPVNPIKYVLN